MDVRVKVIDRTDGSEQVVIRRRDDGSFTCHRQWTDASAINVPDLGWGPLGPELGVYDTPETAELEAMLRVPWLKANFN